MLALSGAVVGTGAFARSAIDPDPGSPTLGELVAGERPVAGPPAVTPPQRRVPVARPRIPQDAVTVIVPGRRLR